MEAIGAAASFIAIGQALAGIPKLVAIIQSIANTREELNELLFELEMLVELSNDLHHCITLVSSEALPNVVAPSEPAYIKRLKTEFDTIHKQLEDLAGDCTLEQQQRISKKLRFKWIWDKSRITNLCERLRRIYKYLQEAMSMLAFRASRQEQRSHNKLLVEIHAVTTQPLLSHKSVQQRETSLIDHSGLRTNPVDYLHNGPWVQCRCKCHYTRGRSAGALTLLTGSFLPKNACSCYCTSHARRQGLKLGFSLWVAKSKINFSMSLSHTGIGIYLSVPFVFEEPDPFAIMDRQSEDAAARWLIQEALPPSALYIDGQSLLEFALNAGHEEIILHWLRNHSHMLLNTEALEIAAIASQIKLHEMKTSTDTETYIYRCLVQLAGREVVTTTIHRALYAHDDLEVAIALQPDLIDDTDVYGEAPLHTACRLGNLKACLTLLRFGADINIRDHQDRTPLHAAANFGHFPIAEVLLDAGCHADMYDGLGMTPMLRAISCSDKDNGVAIFARLLEKGASIRSVDPDGHNTLHFLIFHVKESSSLERIFAILAPAGISLLVEGRNRWGRTPLQTAVSVANVDMVRLLLESGARTDVIDNSGINLLHIAARARVLSLLEQAQIRNLDIRTSDDGKWTPLERFRYFMHTSIEEDLLASVPTQADADAFGCLLQDVRDRGIVAECLEIEQLIPMIRHGEVAEARAGLDKLIKKKIRHEIDEEAKTFRAIDLDIRRGELDLAIESLEDFMEVSRDRMKLSPFDDELCPWCGKYCGKVFDEDQEADSSSGEESSEDSDVNDNCEDDDYKDSDGDDADEGYHDD